MRFDPFKLGVGYDERQRLRKKLSATLRGLERIASRLGKPPPMTDREETINNELKIIMNEVESCG